MDFEFIFRLGKNVNDAVDSWGMTLRNLYQKSTAYRDSDFSVNYLGYYTDNGACYYYNPITNYDDALTNVTISA